jgi:UDP-GlcNAc:undecaprenyl-phosphate GlcNAc-1-phosphate transferase
LSVPFTIFWLLGAINAINLLDGIDGLATTLGIILATTIAVLAVT